VLGIRNPQSQICNLTESAIADPLYGDYIQLGSPGRMADRGSLPAIFKFFGLFLLRELETVD
jgi:hypothetical protein